MAETAKNFFGSFFHADRLTTVEYPEQRITAYEAARVFPFLVYDSKNPADAADWAIRDALRGLPDLRKGVSAQVHLH